MKVPAAGVVLPIGVFWIAPPPDALIAPVVTEPKVTLLMGPGFRGKNVESWLILKIGCYDGDAVAAFAACV